MDEVVSLPVRTIGKIRNVGTNSVDFLTQEAQLASLITRNPTSAQLAATCKGIARFVSTSMGDCSDPITVIIDARFRNLARTRTSGVDLAADYALDTHEASGRSVSRAPR